MTALLLLSLLIPLLLGLMLTWMLFPARKPDAAVVFFHLSLAAGVGLGVASCLYFLAMLPTHAGVLGYLDAALFVVLAFVGAFIYKKVFFRPEEGLPPGENKPHKFRVILPILFSGALISGVVSIVIAFLREPHGKWDAWVIWNLHGRFILRAGENWRDYLASGLEWTHPDYPLLIPLSVVRMWKYAGSETVYGPFVLSLLFTLAVIGLLVFSLAILRGRSQGYLAGLVLLGSPFFLDMGAYQFADIPLAFFFLATLVLFFLYDRFEPRRDYVLMFIGLVAALAAWTKNEGLLFMPVVLAMRFVWIMRYDGVGKAMRQAAWFIGGALPVLIVIAVFKLQVTSNTDIFAGQGLSQIFERLTDSGRYKQIALAYVQTILTFTQGAVNIREGFRFNPGVAGIVLLSLYMVLMGVRTHVQERPALLVAASVLILMMAGYFGVYLITPQDLRWHLLTSLNRLFIQLWPCAVFLCFMLVRTPEQVLMLTDKKDAEISRPDKPGKGKKRLKTAKQA